MKWLPIESAPLDGTNILVYFDCATVPIVHIAFYRGENEYLAGHYEEDWGSIEEWIGWWSYTEHSVTQSKLDCPKPTHWHPFDSPNNSWTD